jgi:hypothetical protein
MVELRAGGTKLVINEQETNKRVLSSIGLALGDPKAGVRNSKGNRLEIGAWQNTPSS